MKPQDGCTEGTTWRLGKPEPMRCAGCTRGLECLGAFLDGGSCAGHLSRLSIAKGEHLFRAGDPVEYLYIVNSGALKSYVVDERGEETVLGFHLPGDVLGIDSVTRPRYAANAVAIGKAQVCRLPSASIGHRVAESEEFRDRLVVGMGREIQRLQRLVHIGRRSAEQRVAAFLLSQAHKLETEGFPGRAQRLPMLRTDIASFLDLATETVSRALSKLQAAGVLKVRRASVEVRNLDQLVAAAHGPTRHSPAARWS